MKNCDIIFIHPPINFQYLKNLSKWRSSFIAIPMGVFGMADLLEREGFSVKIINYPLEILVQSKFSIIKELRKYNFKVIAVDLHWMLYSFGALEILRVVKKVFPSCFTLLGGLSASFFAQEIMKTHEYVDGVIRGEAELPILQLMRNLNSLENVPNLTYRKNGRIKENPITYVGVNLDSLNFSNIKSLDHYKEYLHYSEKTMGIGWSVMVGRGCQYNCLVCGGGRKSSKLVSNREKVSFRSPDRILDELKEVLEYGEVERVYFGHGFHPSIEKYYLEINRLVRKEGLELGAVQEFWRLPTGNKFIKDLRKTYNDKSMVLFSVKSFSESQRRKLVKYMGTFGSSLDFTNVQFRNFLKTIKKEEFTVLIFWDIGHPHETAIDILKNTFQALKTLKYGVTLIMEPIIVSPASPLYLYPEKFGLKLTHRSFNDYYNLMRHAKLGLNPVDQKVTYRTRLLPSFTMKSTIVCLSLISLLSFINSF